MFAMVVVYIATVILIYIVLLIVGLLAVAVFGASGMSFESLATSGASAGLIFFAFLFYAAVLIFFLWFFGRLSVAGPLMAANRSSNPFTALGESWRLTSASQWTIVGFNILMAILFFVFLFIVSMVLGGVIGGMSSPDAGVGALIGALIVALLVYVPMVQVSVSMPAAVYRCVGSRTETDVFA